MKVNDQYLLVPRGMAETKIHKLSKYLEVEALPASIADSRLIGSLVAMNSSGILVSRLTQHEELKELRDATGLPVERLSTRYTSVGNLIAANDKGAIVSSVLPKSALVTVRDVLDVAVESIDIASHVQVGAMVTATNKGAIIHPEASETEISTVSDTLNVEVEMATVNRGVPFVASGVVTNSQNAVVGNNTTGPELMILTKALKI